MSLRASRQPKSKTQGRTIGVDGRNPLAVKRKTVKPRRPWVVARRGRPRGRSMAQVAGWLVGLVRQPWPRELRSSRLNVRHLRS